MMNVVMLSVVMLNVVMLSVVMLNVVMLNVIMLNVVMLNVVMLNVVATKEVNCTEPSPSVRVVCIPDPVSMTQPIFHINKSRSVFLFFNWFIGILKFIFTNYIDKLQHVLMLFLIGHVLTMIFDKKDLV
jgi:hypothetical protein